jgi:dephospho-CoA kinase
MIVIGLTGSIGMGKSTAAGMLTSLGVPVHDSDAAVHTLIGPGGRAVPRIEEVFPGVVKNCAVPLLFETKGDRHCDATILVSAPPFIQAMRVLKRPGMTRERLDHIRAEQMLEAEKKRRADFIIPTGLGYRLTLMHLGEIVDFLSRFRGTHWPPR